MVKNSYRIFRLPVIITFVMLLSLGIFITVLAATFDLSTAESSATINGTIILQFDPKASTSPGSFNRFLVIQKNTTEQGYNTSGTWEFDEKNGTKSITLSAVPQTIISGVVYREFQLDLNEATSTPLISLDKLQFFTASTGNLTGYTAAPPGIGGATNLIYDMDALEDNTLLLNYALQAGSGEADYLVLVPESKFQSASGCYATPASCYVYLYSQFGAYGGVYTSDSGAEEWGTATDGARFNPALNIEKTTNGWTDDVNPVSIMEGTKLTWAYTVTNTGDVTISNISVTDDKLGAVCTITSLAPGDSQTCYMYGKATLGLYQNIGTASGDFAGIIISDQDPSSYNGVLKTAVTFSSISLSAQPPGSVRIRWETESEMDTIGFKLYRTTSSNPEILGANINPSLIMAKHPGDIVGGSYTYEDTGFTPNTRYYYWLEEVLIDNASDLYGPFEILPGFIYLPKVLK